MFEKCERIVSDHCIQATCMESVGTIMDSRAREVGSETAGKAGYALSFPHYYGFIGWKGLKFGKKFA